MRLAIQLGALLIAGAIVNVAVAWSLGYFVLYRGALAAGQALASGPTTTNSSTGERRWPPGFWITCYHGIGAELVRITPTEWTRVDKVDPGPALAKLWPRWGPLASRTPRDPFGAQPQISLGFAARGWPMLSMWCEFEHGYGQVHEGILRDQIHSPETDIVTQRVLPLRPAWTGFAGNTLLYAAILWTLFCLPGLVRRGIRLKGGLCPSCAYPIGIRDICTECGEKLGK